MNKCKQQGSYSVEFVLVFIVFLGTLLLSIDISRMLISRSIIDLKFRELVERAQNDLDLPLVNLQASIFEKKPSFFYDWQQLTISSTSCLNLLNYHEGGCSKGRGIEQQLVRYQLDYQYPRFFVAYFLSNKNPITHQSIIVARNEPDFEGSQW